MRIMKKILVVPHYPLGNIKTRGEELAKHLTKFYKIYFLSWKYNPNYNSNTLIKFFSRIKPILTKTKIYGRDNMRILEAPLIYLRNIPKKLQKIVKRYNAKLVEKLARKYKIDLILSSGGSFLDLSKSNIPYIYDVVDLPGDEINDQVNSAKGIIVCSSFLKKNIKLRFNRSSELIPNGATLSNFRLSGRAKIREKYGLDKKFVIGFIGNHASWSGLDFLIDFYKEIKKDIENSCLFIVGPGTEIRSAEDKVKKEKIKDVIFTGRIDPKNIFDYFVAIDFAVLPFKKMKFTDYAFPIKILEYSAAKKLIISTPLEELKTLKLKNLYLVNRNVADWKNIFLKVYINKWDKSWDKYVKEYDWKIIALKTKKFIENKI